MDPYELHQSVVTRVSTSILKHLVNPYEPQHADSEHWEGICNSILTHLVNPYEHHQSDVTRVSTSILKHLVTMQNTVKGSVMVFLNILRILMNSTRAL